jgi:hypothetical protein
LVGLRLAPRIPQPTRLSLSFVCCHPLDVFLLLACTLYAFKPYHNPVWYIAHRYAKYNKWNRPSCAIHKLSPRQHEDLGACIRACRCLHFKTLHSSFPEFPRPSCPAREQPKNQNRVLIILSAVDRYRFLDDDAIPYMHTSRSREYICSCVEYMSVQMMIRQNAKALIKTLPGVY